jgi:hypothetical protein
MNLIENYEIENEEKTLIMLWKFEDSEGNTWVIGTDKDETEEHAKQMILKTLTSE